ncbi:MAG: type II secretion system protein [Planctomycetaceae bacterium]|nr:type II secretion system protein [Planctomycetaceae bacterium]
MNRQDNMRQQPSPTKWNQATGFSLVELLVAIGIVVLLSALVGLTLRGILEGAKEKRTQVTLLKIHKMIQQVEVEIDKAERTERGSGRQNVPSGTYELVVANDNAFSFMSRKYKYKSSLPQRFEDMVGIDGVPGALERGNTAGANIDDDSDSNANYAGGRIDYKEFPAPSSSVVSDDSALARLVAKKLAEGITVFNPANHKENTESSELFYLLFNEGAVYGVTSEDAGEFAAHELDDTDNDGLLEIVDAWGNPLRFYRWPTRLVKPASGLTSNSNENPYWDILSNVKYGDLATKSDPYDQTATYTPTIAAAGFFQEGSTNATLQYVLHTPNTYYTFLIVSAGPDGILGLEEPTNYTQLGHLAHPLLSIRTAVDAASGDDAKLSVIYDSVLVDDLSNLQLDQP